MEDHMLELLREYPNNYTEVCGRLRMHYKQNEYELPLEDCYRKRQQIMLLG